MIESVDVAVDFGFEDGDVGREIGRFGGKNAFHKVDKGLLVGKGDVGYRELFPVVRIKMDVASTICSQEVAGRRGVHDSQKIFNGESLAGGLQFLALR